MKQLFIFLTAIAAAGTLFFWREVWGLFAGMSPLEALGMIVQFLLHIGALTVVGMLIGAIPKMIKPWMRLGRNRTARRDAGRRVAEMPTPPMPKVNSNAVLMAFLQQQAQKTVKSKPQPSQPAETVGIHLDF